MSNFPILPTTPPPLDFDGSEEEEELEFRTFNDVSHEEEKDIDFVVPDFNPENELEEKTSSDDKIAFQGKTSEEELDNRSIDEKTNNSCDNDFEKEFEILKNDDNSDKSTSNDIHLDSNRNQFKEYVLKNDIFEKSSEDEKFVSEEIKDLSDNCLNNNENDFDFADFTSYESTKCEENSDPSKDFSDENQSISFYKSDLSFGDSRDESNYKAINDSKINENNLNNTESDDDFADFASAQPVLNTHFESDFKPNFPETKQSDEFDDEFADFSSFQDNNTNNGFIDNSTISLNQTSTEEKQKITEMFAQVFPSQESNDSVGSSPNISRDMFNSAELNSKSLWKQLQDLESAPSLKLRWPTSHSFQLLLTALNIDPRNILRNSSVPVFASGLGCVLEPTKPKINCDLNDEIDSENTESLTTGSIPPVQFDWSSSGLTNPLDANQKSMVAFDLDFFVTNDDVKNSYKQTCISNFEDEFLNTKNNNNSDNFSVVSDTNKNDLMQQILCSVTNTSSMPKTKTNGSQVLSAEAIQVLDELPNLSFLRAKVLMFPMNIRTNSKT